MTFQTGNLNAFATLCITGINRAEVTVITVQLQTGYTKTVGTDVAHGTGIIVTAIPLIEGVLTPLYEVTTIIGARVVVVTVEGLPTTASPLQALLRQSTGIPVVAGLPF